MDDVLREIHDAAEVHQNLHFVYTSGEHGEDYVDLRALGRLPNNAPIVLKASLLLLERIIKHAGIDVTKPIVILGPETLGAQMAKQLWYTPASDLSPIVPDRTILTVGILKKALSGFAWETTPEKTLGEGAQVIFFDDLLNAASTFAKARELVEQQGATIAAIGVIGDRSGLSASDLGVRHIEALERFEFKRYKPEECPLCKSKKPIVLKPGHGFEYKSAYPDYPGGFQSL